MSPGASLPRIQDYVVKMETERVLDKQDLPSQCLKLGEEVGQLFRAVRKQGDSPEPGGRIADIGDEAADYRLGRQRGIGTSDPGMIGYTLPEIRRLQASLVQHRSPDPDASGPGSRWRRRRQY